jgi:hypothetical protein
VHDFQAVARSGVDGFALDGAEGGAQGQAAHAAHAVDTNFHVCRSSEVEKSGTGSGVDASRNFELSGAPVTNV